MTNAHRLGLSLIAAVSIAGWTMPVSAAELAVPPPHKVVAVAHKKPTHALIRMADAGLASSFPIVLGVGF
jgi:hypothetical protein